MDISIIMVSWNVLDLLRQSLRSIRLQGSDDKRQMEIIVVDNASSDGSVKMLHDEFPDVRVIANSQNLGFTRGNNQALEIAQGRCFFLINPDTQLHPHALENLSAYMDAHPRVGIIGPRLVYGDGAPQSSRRRFPALATAFLESTKLQEWFPRNRTLTHYYMLDTSDDEIQTVDWINGSAMFVRREVYDQLGGFDEGFFMYSEELDWCYRVKQAGWQIVYLPTAQVTHYEGKSSEQATPQRVIYFHSSKVRFFRKYHGRFVAVILRLFLLLMYLFLMVEEGFKWLMGSKRELRVARLRAFALVLKSRLKS